MGSIRKQTCSDVITGTSAIIIFRPTEQGQWGGRSSSDWQRGRVRERGIWTRDTIWAEWDWLPEKDRTQVSVMTLNNPGETGRRGMFHSVEFSMPSSEAESRGTTCLIVKPPPQDMNNIRVSHFKILCTLEIVPFYRHFMSWWFLQTFQNLCFCLL